jgi:hypothetical protein
MRFMRGGGHSDRWIRTTFLLLLQAQALVLFADVVVAVFLFLRWYLLREILFGFTYAIKLNVEFLILNRLKSFRERPPEVVEV